MKNFYKILFFAALSVLVAGCGEKGPDGPDGIEVSGVTLSENSLSIIKGGMSRLSYTVEPEDAEVSSVSWESSDPAVASVDGNGLVTAVEIGSLMGISDRMVRKHIALLRNAHIIYRHGSNKSGYWRLLDEEE